MLSLKPSKFVGVCWGRFYFGRKPSILFYLWLWIAIKLTCHSLLSSLLLLIIDRLLVKSVIILFRLRSAWKVYLLFRPLNICPRVIKCKGLSLLEFWSNFVDRFLTQIFHLGLIIAKLLLVVIVDFRRSNLIKLKLLRIGLQCNWLSLFVNESLFYLFLSHHVRKWHIVDPQLKMLSVFR